MGTGVANCRQLALAYSAQSGIRRPKKTATLRDSSPELPDYHFSVVVFYLFLVDCCMNLHSLICDGPLCLVLIFLPLLYLLIIQTQWHVLGKFKGYFVLMHTRAAMFQISDVNIADKFLRGDSKSDFSLLLTSSHLLSHGSCPQREQDTKALCKAPSNHSFPSDR